MSICAKFFRMLGQLLNQIWNQKVKKVSSFPGVTIRNQDINCHNLVVYLSWNLPINTGHAQVFYGPSNVGPWTLGGEENNYDSPEFIVAATTTLLPGDVVYYYVHYTSGLNAGNTAVQGPFTDGACSFPPLVLGAIFSDCTDLQVNADWFNGGAAVVATGATYTVYTSTAGAGGPFTPEAGGSIPYDNSGHLSFFADATGFPPNTNVWFFIRVTYGTQVIDSEIAEVFNGPC
jgi:hypothetical protein